MCMVLFFVNPFMLRDPSTIVLAIDDAFFTKYKENRWFYSSTLSLSDIFQKKFSITRYFQNCPTFFGRYEHEWL